MSYVCTILAENILALVSSHSVLDNCSLMKNVNVLIYVLETKLKISFSIFTIFHSILLYHCTLQNSFLFQALFKYKLFKFKFVYILN